MVDPMASAHSLLYRHLFNCSYDSFSNLCIVLMRHVAFRNNTEFYRTFLRDNTHIEKYSYITYIKNVYESNYIEYILYRPNERQRSVTFQRKRMYLYSLDETCSEWRRGAGSLLTKSASFQDEDQFDLPSIRFQNLSGMSFSI
jgi:hypothetical protein